MASDIKLDKQELLQALLDTVPGFVWIADATGCLRLINREWCNFTGLDEAHSLEHGWISALHPEDQAPFAAVISEAARDQFQQHEHPVRFRKSDGSFRWHIVRARVFDAQNGLWIGCSFDVHDQIEREKREVEQRQILEMVAGGASLRTILEALCLYAEREVVGAKCSIMLVDNRAGIFTDAIAPSLPPQMFDGAHGMRIATGIGSCGTAAFERRDVIVADISTDPLWDSLRGLADMYRLRSCWSRPVLSALGETLATFGFYFDHVRIPTTLELERLEGIRHLASVSIEKRLTFEALRESEEHHRQTVELNPQVPWTADPDGMVLTVSSRWTALTGIPPAKALGMGWLDALHPDDAQPTLVYWRQQLKSGEPVDTRYRIRLTDGSFRWVRARAAPRRDERGQIIRWYGAVEDIHDQQLAELHLRKAACEDPLTGLANRRGLEQALRFHLAEPSAGFPGLILVDLDDFKHVNDRFGHPAGDEVLRLVGRSLSKLFKAPELVARLGGDEFAVVIPPPLSAAALATRVTNLASALQASLRRSGKARLCNVSIGFALASEGDTPDELLKKADTALYASKAAPNTSVKQFVPEMREAADQKRAQLELARLAVSKDWLVPYYQPKVSLPDGNIVGWEALLRIDHPKEGILPPSAVSVALEHPHLGHAIGQRMMMRVLADMRSFADQAEIPMQVAVNLSSATLYDQQFADWLLGALKRTKVPANLLTLEITERVLLDELHDLRRGLQALRRLGAGIALDDFGTGYASLTHLQKYPVTELKIDQCFMEDLTEGTGNAAIVRTMIALGNNLGLKVVAEGVQSASQALLLHGWGCHAAQGFHFGKPMPLNAAVKVWNMENRRERGTGVATSAICRPDGFGDTQVRRWTDHESAPNTKQYSRPRVQA